MRSTWQEWVIWVSLGLICLTGIGAIWGGDLKRLVIEASRGESSTQSTQPAEPPPQQEIDLPGGVPAGPF